MTLVERIKQHFRPFYLVKSGKVGRKNLQLGYILRLQLIRLGDRLHLKDEKKKGA